ncbi:MAG: hypothetical protein MZU97_03810 [Bacillus subtilis]|nr:hypothetical protein [Bacillus subtilis]
MIGYLVTIAKRPAINEYHKTKRVVVANDAIDYLPTYDVSALGGRSPKKNGS